MITERENSIALEIAYVRQSIAGKIATVLELRPPGLAFPAPPAVEAAPRVTPPPASDTTPTIPTHWREEDLRVYGPPGQSRVESQLIDLTGLSKEQVLSALWNNARQLLNQPHLEHPVRYPLSYRDAGYLVRFNKEGEEFGRVQHRTFLRYDVQDGEFTDSVFIGVRLDESGVLDPSRYDQEYGAGAASAAITKLRRDLQPIDIGGLPKDFVLAALVNHLYNPPYAGTISATPAEAARVIAKQGLKILYLQQRWVDVDLAVDTINPASFDSWSGQGAARRAIMDLREKLEPIGIANRSRTEILLELIEGTSGDLQRDFVTRLPELVGRSLVNNPASVAIPFRTQTVRLDLSGEYLDPTPYDQLMGIGSARARLISLFWPKL